MTTAQEEYIVYAMLATLIVVALIGHICTNAPVWDQEEEAVSGHFYVKPLGGDHE